MAEAAKRSSNERQSTDSLYGAGVEGWRLLRGRRQVGEEGAGGGEGGGGGGGRRRPRSRSRRDGYYRVREYCGQSKGGAV